MKPSRMMRGLATALPLAMAAQANDAPERFWEQPYPTQLERDSLTVEQDVIRVEGKRFVDERGNTFVFRGMNVADPSKLVTDGQWDRRLFDEIRAWGANTVRLPVHPSAWRYRGRDEYLELIDDAVRWANELGMYLIIDWHSIGYLPSELYQHDMYVTTRQETLSFWRDIAFRYQGVPTVAVYELFNEPTTLENTLGRRDWSEWRALNEYLIDMIRARDPDVIPLVTGFNWAYDLRYVRDEPVEREGIAYAAHPYPQKATPAVPGKEHFFALWEEYWGFVADTYPMILTEIGWVREDGHGAHVPVIDDGRYGPMIAEYIESKGLSWTGWVFDPDWSPVMIEDWEFTPSEQGAFFRQLLLDAAD
ncbi:MAG: glycoside hydrolase family 5 protein [Proteobacteria bacterium]|nr:glycoside hydrolase family 5 protein [Pseudomonadota bacterium]